MENQQAIPTPISQPVQQQMPASSNINKLLVFIIILLIILGGSGWFMFLQSRQTVTPAVATSFVNPSPVNTLIPTVDVPTLAPTLVVTTQSWKHYANQGAGFSFDYPPTWTVKDVDENSVKPIGASATGPEGFMSVLWGSGFGGGPCPSKHIVIQTRSGNMDMCDSTDNGKEYMSGSNDGPTYQINGITFMFKATINPPFSANKALITKILNSVGTL